MGKETLKNYTIINYCTSFELDNNILKFRQRVHKLYIIHLMQYCIPHNKILLYTFYFYLRKRIQRLVISKSHLRQ